MDRCSLILWSLSILSKINRTANSLALKPYSRMLSILSKINFVDATGPPRGKETGFQFYPRSTCYMPYAFAKIDLDFQFYPRSTSFILFHVSAAANIDFQFYPRSTSFEYVDVYLQYDLSILSKINAGVYVFSVVAGGSPFQFYPRSTALRNPS